jgi:hypothetical protein
MDVHGTLPWSILRQDSAAWQARKKYWAGLGVDDIGPRAHAPAMANSGRHGRTSGGVSRFDSHLGQVLLSWYCPPGGRVVDPFAGGPVRGLVAGRLGYSYAGIDLLAPQVEANRARALDWAGRGMLATMPEWFHGAAQEELPSWPEEFADYVLTCPPYHNRERYSDDPRDLSVMRWPAFLDTYQAIIAQAVRVLRPDRFGSWVVSDVRDHRGHLRGLPALTTAALTAAGAHLVNEQILVEPGGLRAKLMRPAWTAARTATRNHQLVLTFVKGDRRAAARAARGDGEC